MTNTNQQYNIVLNNDSGKLGTIILYQVYPKISEDIYFPIVWNANTLYTNQKAYFSWNPTSFCSVWSQTGNLKESVVCLPAQAEEMDPFSTNEISFSYDKTYLLHDSNTNGSAGKLTLKENQTIPTNNLASVGIGMKGSPTLLVQAYPQTLLQFDVTDVQYWVAFGNYKKGEALVIDHVMNPSQVNFSSGSKDMSVTIDSSQNWEVRPMTKAEKKEMNQHIKTIEMKKPNTKNETYKNSSTDDLLFALQQRNLVYNHNFLYYSNKTVDTQVVYNHPDGWIYKDEGSGGEITYDITSNCCRIKTSSGSDEMSFSQGINEFPRWETTLKQQAVSATAVLQSADTCEVEFSINDGVYETSKKVKLLPNAQTKIDIEIDVNSAATQLLIAVKSTASNVVIDIYEIVANIGSIALPNLPCIVEGFIGERKQYVSTAIPPAQEISLCNGENDLEVPANYTRLNSFLNGKFGKGKNGRSLLPNMSGYFSRGWDNGATIDPNASGRTALGNGKVTGDCVSTVQQDEFKEHNHQLKFDTTSTTIPGTSGSPLPIINKAAVSTTEKTGGAETRPKNIYELYTMKWA